MDRFQALNRRLAATWAERNVQRARLSPTEIGEGMERIQTALARFAAAGTADGAPTPEQDQITELSELALGLLGELVSAAASLDLDDIGREARALSLDLADWTADQGATLRVIEPVVDAIAGEANGLRDPEPLAHLYRRITRVAEAVAPAARKSANPHRPSEAWRMLLMNRAIVATRTLEPAFMEAAFDTLATELPEDAPRFFAEGMGQLDIVGYPPRVREVMTRYYARFGSTSKTLH